MITITRASDGATTTPDVWALPADVTDESRNVETDLISGDMAIALVTPRPGTGDLTLVYGAEADARAARLLHRGRSSFDLDDTDHPARNITYVLGPGGIRLGRGGGGEWTVVVSYREVEL